ncbi:hypothetical protein KC19_4G134800 [Ceratodon purpureus]|uniref:Hexosyltransferase n=1 Tax=Ceratodon purpureus TaxID=3225 RepID=A0A8T0IAU1_CERPU|nr:hypothetical protein KC19_4G134800 [Ceratodon purpureus]
MEEGEGWKEKPRANNTRARIADALFQYSNKFAQFISQWVRVLAYMRTDAEAYLRKVVLNQGEKGLSDHERRKHKHSKLKQIITPLRTGRVGFVFLLLAVIGMLAYISQDTSVHHVERDSVRGTLASQANNARVGELSLNRKLAVEEVQAEIVDAWPQESAQITSLRRRAAAGTLKVGLLNLKPTTDIGEWKFLAASKRPVSVPFRRASKHVSWKNLFPEWIDEEAKFGDPRCPFYPMPKIPAVPYVSRTIQLDVVIARAPCAEPTTLQEGWKHPAILQVLLGAANLAAETGHESIYVLILSKCRPLVNLFPCRELVEHHDEGWLYHMNVQHLKSRTSLPIGSCQLSVRLSSKFYVADPSPDIKASNSQKEAYTTILHSGGDYVCGAIATAHSIRRTGSTRDLVALVDGSISPEHRKGLEEAGWTLRDYLKITSSSSLGKQKDFSMFRLWQLDYDKVIYLESDIIVLRNIDHLFKLPEVAASGTTQSVFNSGLMVLEPSNCTFQILMDEMEKLASEVDDDWDFFNRVFPWWHRIPKDMNSLKYFWSRDKKSVDNMNRLFSANPPELYAIHYVRGKKPWKCFRDYDCNWNADQHYASDEAHAQWFKVHDQMPENLQKHCALSTRALAELEHDRRAAQSNDTPDKHWAINITDPRVNVCQGKHCDLNLCEQNHCDWNAMTNTINPTVDDSSKSVPLSKKVNSLNKVHSSKAVNSSTTADSLNLTVNTTDTVVHVSAG